MFKKLVLFIPVLILKLNAWAQPDLTASQISSPNSGLGLLSTETIILEYYNYGSDIQPGDSLLFSYSINNGPWVNETKMLSALFPYFGFDTYTFTTEADLSVPNNYEVKVVVSHLSDTYRYNDTIVKTVIHAANPMLAFVTPFEITQDQSNYPTIEGIGTNFFTYEFIYFIQGGDTIIPTNVTPPDFPNFLDIVLEVPCSKPKGFYELHVKTTTDGWMYMSDAIKVVSSIYSYNYVYPPQCHNDANGSIDINAMGGSQFLSYAWSTGAVTSSISDLPAGAYSLVITDDITGCTYEESFIFDNPPPMTVSVHKVDSDCGLENGYAWVVINGGVPPYDINWPDEMGGDTLFNIIGNSSFYVDVFDENYCLFSLPVTVYDQLTLDVNTSQVLCGSLDGQATVSIANGFAPYSILWSNGDTGTSADSLSAGQHLVQVTDANSCYGSLPFLVEGINGPQVSFSVSPISCESQPNGAIDLTVSGGQAPYTYLWSNGATTQDIAGLSPGTYQIVVRDASGCSYAECIEVSSSNAFALNWYSSSTPTCLMNDGSIELYPEGGVIPYNVQWSANAGIQSGTVATNLAAGFYYAIVTDAAGCTDSLMTTLSNYDAPYFYLDNSNEGTCGANDAYIEITPAGGAGFGYNTVWDNTNMVEDLYNTNPGSHYLTISDAFGCYGNFIIELGSVQPAIQEICLVTVDSLTGKNLVVWEKATLSNISHYNIYRETCEPSGFAFVGMVPYDSLSQFLDLGADPFVQSWKYKMTAVSDCGIESDFSAMQKTIHLYADRTLSTSVDLSWDYYIGFGFTEQIIWRHHQSTGWQIIDTVSST
ncbi:MAG: SprB repeat-containing protein, partial [Flavobacteriales bacterium]